MTPHDAPDPHLPLLTAVRAERLRGLVAGHLHARTGVRPTVAGDTAEADGRRHPLTNLAQRCHTAPEDTWPELVEGFFARLAAGSQGGESAEELLARTCLRLVPPGAVPADMADGFTYLRGVAEGLNLALALDGPTSVRLLTDQDVARAGADALWAAGQRNLVREPLRHEEVRLDGHAVLYSVYGDSPFVSTKALVLPELVAEVTGRRMPDAGALVVVPTRHLLAFHPIVDGSVADAVNDLATYAYKAHEDGPGSLSPRVYWWHRGRLTSLTVIDHDTRTFSLRPPAELLDIMRALHGLDRAGRLASDSAATAPGIDELTTTTADSIEGLAADPSGFPDAFAHALALAHAQAATDPGAARVETWDAWVAALQLGTALFTPTAAVGVPLGEGELTVPATGPDVLGDARAWLDAFYLTLVTRERDRTTRLCQVPPDDLRGDTAPVDDYVLHWIDVLQSHWLRRPVDDVVQKLVTTMETSHPETATLAPKDFLNSVDYQPVALFHRLLTEDHDAFAVALAEALAQHGSYWGDSAAPRARVALGPLALACLAHDMEFPVDAEAPYLPKYLLNRERLEEIPGQG
ncbi:immunity 49 family protein [Streptomyces kunmingensis]|uniref:Immunity 49 family protein n=1 Tax=Streptomyces kunmingensis TaxID=68225 RepID=A0ABU6CB29_9ACTN|nr:immunity 49 family protein [Streptomyces kunmingensis]MEB3961915.1 immunity 49 family protein [Streptomyces kunmingensis]